MSVLALFRHRLNEEFKVEKAAQARYVRVEVEGTLECPSWHYGVGHPSWFFIDEVVVN